MSNFTLQVTVQVDIQNAESIQQARESVFALLSAPKESKSRKGRPASGPKATVTGVQIPTEGLGRGVVTVSGLSDAEYQKIKSDVESGLMRGIDLTSSKIEVTETTP